jgi:hypothetical protein
MDKQGAGQYACAAQNLLLYAGNRPNVPGSAGRDAAIFAWKAPD